MRIEPPIDSFTVDLTMMASLGGFERTRKEFETLLDTAGLRVLEVHRYDAKMQSVIIAALK
jgi:demethylsterigmatocystin 6-O-methyltransferase